MPVRASVCAAVFLLGPASISCAQDVRARFVALGAGGGPIPAAGLILPPGTSRTIMLQLAVFDGEAPAPAGGVAGWQHGAFSTSGGLVSRQMGYGREWPFISPFTPDDPIHEGLPAGDPFTQISGIFGREDLQPFNWFQCEPLPPPPVIRGRNAFARVYRLTVQMPLDEPAAFEISTSGELLAASSWEHLYPPYQNPFPCYCPCDSIGCCWSVFYGPVLLPPASFSRSVWISPTPPCPADWNRSGAADTDDFFGFLDGFLAGHADFDGDGGTQSDDFFDFLAAFFQGCP